ncbi:MAG: hypothetical protein HY868_10760 [Chloroflexi bacterium]|nr:hypothetical protein [Chloroflexota bacterium]
MSVIGATVTSAVLGMAIGLAIAWLGVPVPFWNTSPASLRQSIKNDYVRMISASYELSGDLPLARRRLEQLELSDPARTFLDLIAQEKQSLGNSAIQDSLIHLGQALGYRLPYTAQRPAPGARTSSDPIALPTQAIATFVLKEHTKLTCTEEPDAAFLRLIVRDQTGRDLPNMAIAVRSANGEEIVYTGLKPERGLGYADVQVEPGKYAVTILNAPSEAATDLLIGAPPANCRNDRGATPRGWKIVFQQK